MDFSKLLAPAIATASAALAGQAAKQVAARRTGDKKTDPTNPETPLSEALIIALVTAGVAAILKTVATRKANQIVARRASR